MPTSRTYEETILAERGTSQANYGRGVTSGLPANYYLEQEPQESQDFINGLDPEDKQYFDSLVNNVDPRARVQADQLLSWLARGQGTALKPYSFDKEIEARFFYNVWKNSIVGGVANLFIDVNARLEANRRTIQDIRNPLITERPDRGVITELGANLALGTAGFVGAHVDVLLFGLGSLAKGGFTSKLKWFRDTISGTNSARAFYQYARSSTRNMSLGDLAKNAYLYPGLAEVAYGGVSSITRYITGAPSRDHGPIEDFLEGGLNGVIGGIIGGAIPASAMRTVNWYKTGGNPARFAGKEGGPPSSGFDPEGVSPRPSPKPDSPTFRQDVTDLRRRTAGNRSKYLAQQELQAAQYEAVRKNLDRKDFDAELEKYSDLYGDEFEVTKSPYNRISDAASRTSNRVNETIIPALLKSLSTRVHLDKEGALWENGVLVANSNSMWAKLAVKYQAEADFVVRDPDPTPNDPYGMYMPTRNTFLSELTGKSRTIQEAVLQRTLRIDPQTGEIVGDDELRNILDSFKDGTGYKWSNPEGSSINPDRDLSAARDRFAGKDAAKFIKDSTETLFDTEDAKIQEALETIGNILAGGNAPPGTINPSAIAKNEIVRGLIHKDASAFLYEAREKQTQQMLNNFESSLKDKSRAGINTESLNYAIASGHFGELLNNNFLSSLARFIDKWGKEFSQDSLGALFDTKEQRGRVGRIYAAVRQGHATTLNSDLERECAQMLIDTSNVIRETAIQEGMELGFLEGHLAQPVDPEFIVKKGFDAKSFAEFVEPRINWERTTASKIKETFVKHLDLEKGQLSEKSIEKLAKELTATDERFKTLEGRINYLEGVHEFAILGDDYVSTTGSDRTNANAIINRKLHFKDSNSYIDYLENMCGIENVLQLTTQNAQRMVSLITRNRFFGTESARVGKQMNEIILAAQTDKPNFYPNELNLGASDATKDWLATKNLEKTLIYANDLFLTKDAGSRAILSASGAMHASYDHPLYNTLVNLVNLLAVKHLGKVVRFTIEDEVKLTMLSLKFGADIGMIMDSIVTPQGDIMGSEVSDLINSFTNAGNQRYMVWGPAGKVDTSYFGSDRVRVVSSAIFKYSGADYLTNRAKSQARGIFARQIGENIDFEWSQLSANFRAMAQGLGISKNVWDILRKPEYVKGFLSFAEKEEATRARYYNPHSVSRITSEQDRRAFAIFYQAMQKFTNLAVPEGNKYTTEGAFGGGNGPPGQGAGPIGSFMRRSFSTFLHTTAHTMFLNSRTAGLYGNIWAILSSMVVQGFFLMCAFHLLRGESLDLGQYDPSDWNTLANRTAKSSGTFGLPGDVISAGVIAAVESDTARQGTAALANELVGFGSGAGISIGARALGTSVELVSNLMHGRWRDGTDNLTTLLTPNIGGLENFIHGTVLDSIDNATQNENFVSPYSRRVAARQRHQKTFSIIGINKAHQQEYNRKVFPLAKKIGISMFKLREQERRSLETGNKSFAENQAKRTSKTIELNLAKIQELDDLYKSKRKRIKPIGQATREEIRAFALSAPDGVILEGEINGGP